MPVTPSEIELKLVVAEGRFAGVPRGFRRAAFRPAKVDDIYYDTEGGILRGHALALRLRRDGRRWVQTLKAADRRGHVVSERGEWEVGLGEGRTRPELALDHFADTPLGALINAGLSAGALVPVFRTRFVRRRLILAHRTSTIEVALDEGELIALLGDRTARRPIVEVELELKSGEPADVIDLAQRLVRKSRTTLVPALRSKAERGYALASGTVLPVARASAAGFAKLMAAGISSNEALRAVMRHGLAILVANADALRGASASEHLHQARVALRRMRSAIRLLDAQGTDVPLPIVRRLQKLAQALGEARDWDVLSEVTLPAVQGYSETNTRFAEELTNSTQRLRREAMDAAIAAVGSRRYARLVLALARWSVSASPPSPRLADTVGALLEPLADDLAAGARAFEQLSRSERHRVRIHAKRLRYALDLLRFALPGKNAADYVDALATLQDTLGALYDAAVGRKRFGKAVSRRSDQRLVKAWYAAVEPALVERAARELNAFTRRARPWHMAA